METMLGHTRVPSVISHKWSVVAGVWGSTASRVSVLSSKCFSKSVEASVEGLNCELTSVLLKLVALFECSVWKFWNPESEFRFEVSESNPLLNTGSLRFKLSSSSQLKAMLPWNTLFCWLRIWLAVPKTRLFRTDSGWVSSDLGTLSPSKIALFRRLLTPFAGVCAGNCIPGHPPLLWVYAALRFENVAVSDMQWVPVGYHCTVGVWSPNFLGAHQKFPLAVAVVVGWHLIGSSCWLHWGRG